MKAYVSTDVTNYEIENIISINFTAGTLTIIYKNENGTVKTTQYTADSLTDGQVNII